MPRDGTEEGTPPGAPGLSALLSVTPLHSTSQLLQLATCALSHPIEAPESSTKSPKTEDSVVGDPVLRSPMSAFGGSSNACSLLNTGFVQKMVEQSVADHFQKTFGVEVVQGATKAKRPRTKMVFETPEQATQHKEATERQRKENALLAKARTERNIVSVRAPHKWTNCTPGKHKRDDDDRTHGLIVAVNDEGVAVSKLSETSQNKIAKLVSALQKMHTSTDGPMRTFSLKLSTGAEENTANPGHPLLWHKGQRVKGWEWGNNVIDMRLNLEYLRQEVFPGTTKEGETLEKWLSDFGMLTAGVRNKMFPERTFDPDSWNQRHGRLAWGGKNNEDGMPTIVYVKASDKLNDTRKLTSTALQTRQQDLESQRKNASPLAAVEDIAREDGLAIVRITVDNLTRKLTVTPAADDKAMGGAGALSRTSSVEHAVDNLMHVQKKPRDECFDTLPVNRRSSERTAISKSLRGKQ